MKFETFCDLRKFTEIESLVVKYFFSRFIVSVERSQQLNKLPENIHKPSSHSSRIESSSNTPYYRPQLSLTMNSKMFTRISSLIFSRNTFVRRQPIRFNTTGQPEAPKAAAEPPKAPPPQPPKTPQDLPKEEKFDGKGKGPVTWKSFSMVLVGGAGLLVSYI